MPEYLKVCKFLTLRGSAENWTAPELQDKGRHAQAMEGQHVQYEPLYQSTTVCSAMGFAIGESRSIARIDARWAARVIRLQRATECKATKHAMLLLSDAAAAHGAASGLPQTCECAHCVSG